jgi:hypothetical protein
MANQDSQNRPDRAILEYDPKSKPFFDNGIAPARLPDQNFSSKKMQPLQPCRKIRYLPKYKPSQGLV